MMLMLLHWICIRKRMRLEPFQQGLIHDQHGSALNARPYGSWTYASKPAGYAFCLVDDP
jgi:hypothetical protein